MKAILLTRYGSPDAFKPGEIPIPAPKADEIRIKVHAATVTAGDCEMRRFDFPVLFWLPLRLYMGVFKPRKKILGQELSGVVDAVGDQVSRFKVGDRVLAATMFRFGAYAEYQCVPEKYAIAHIPDTLTFAQAAAVPVGALNAQHFVRLAKLNKDKKILIYGTSGSIGTYAVQLAKRTGAEVTAVCSTSKLELVKSLGADYLIDYTQQDFTQNGQQYDAILDTVGKSPFSDSLKSLTENGLYILANPRLSDMLRGLWRNLISSQKVIFNMAAQSNDELQELIPLLADGRLKVVIDRSYPLDQLADAHRYVELGHKAGNVIISIRAE